MVETKHASNYADPLQKRIEQLGWNQEFVILYKQVETLSPIDLLPADFDFKYDFKYETRLVQPVRTVRPNRLVVSFLKALRASRIIPMTSAEFKEQSFDIRYAVLLNEATKKNAFSLYLSGTGDYGYVNGGHVRIEGAIARWLQDFCQRNFTY